MTREDICREASIEGKLARRKGELRSANPYPGGTLEHYGWSQGWRVEARFAEIEMWDETDVRVAG